MGISSLVSAVLAVPLSSGAPSDVVTTAGSAGAANQAARGDHAHKLIDTGWLAPTLQNGWANYAAPYSPAGYRKVGNIVLLRGLVQNGTAAHIFTLPPGYRPLIQHLFAAMCNANVACRIDVRPDGVVTLSGGYSNTWVSMSNLVFSADD